MKKNTDSKAESLTKLYAQLAMAKERNDTKAMRNIEMVIKRLENKK